MIEISLYASQSRHWNERHEKVIGGLGANIACAISAKKLLIKIPEK